MPIAHQSGHIQDTQSSGQCSPRGGWCAGGGRGAAGGAAASSPPVGAGGGAGAETPRQCQQLYGEVEGILIWLMIIDCVVDLFIRRDPWVEQAGGVAGAQLVLLGE